jgi:hypothetical protein
VEIIGWIYQFYISEKKDEVIGKVVKSEDIPAATQLFTPNWIVKYMVQNSLGAQWLATYPDSPLKGQMAYYIEPAEQTPEVGAALAALTPASLDPEALTLMDPACVPLNAPAREAIAVRAAFRAQHCPASPWVFWDVDGNRVQSIKRSWATACRRAGIEDFRIHDLRHTCAAWLVSAGVPLTEVRDLLGHSTVRMTERYAHLAPENVRAAVARLEVQTEGRAPPSGGGESRSGHVGLKMIRGGRA